MEIKEFSEKIKTALIESGKTRAVIANEMNISLRTLDNWCTDISLPDIGQLQKYAAITKKTILWFYGMEPNESAQVLDLREQNKKLESDRDYWREQAIFLKDMLQKKS